MVLLRWRFPQRRPRSPSHSGSPRQQIRGVLPGRPRNEQSIRTRPFSRRPNQERLVVLLHLVESTMGAAGRILSLQQRQRTGVDCARTYVLERLQQNLLRSHTPDSHQRELAVDAVQIKRHAARVQWLMPELPEQHGRKQCSESNAWILRAAIE